MARRAGVPEFDNILTEALSSQPDAGTDAMIDATSELLASYGLRRWSMDDVAARSGLARATVYRRFESRDQLVRATLIRDARRFFAAIAAAVQPIGSFEEKVVEGFVVGLELVRLSPVPRLLDSDPAAALTLLSSESFLRAGRRALVESYESMIGEPVPRADRRRVEAVAETLVRLGLSLLLTPGLLGGVTAGAGDRRDNMRQALQAVIAPLVTTSPPARNAGRPGAGGQAERLSPRSAPRG